MAPIFSCVATLLLVGTVYFAVTRNRRKGRWFGKFSFPRPSLRPVRYEAPKDDWVIDHPEDTSVGGQESRADVEASRSSLSLDNHHLRNNNGVEGPYLGNVNNSKSASRKKILQKLKHSASNSNMEKNGSTSTLASAPRPPALDLTSSNDPSPALASKWSDSDSCHTVPQQAKRLPGSATFSALVNHVKIPFGHRPHRLQHVAPDPRFQLDDYDATPPGSRKPTYDQTIAGILANTGRSGGREAAGRPETRPVNEERQSLITEEDRMSNNVFLISKRPGEDFTVESSRGWGSGVPSSRPVNSDIQVQSPTESNHDSEFLKTYGQPQEQVCLLLHRFLFGPLTYLGRSMSSQPMFHQCHAIRPQSLLPEPTQTHHIRLRMCLTMSRSHRYYLRALPQEKHQTRSRLLLLVSFQSLLGAMPTPQDDTPRLIPLQMARQGFDYCQLLNPTLMHSIKRHRRSRRTQRGLCRMKKADGTFNLLERIRRDSGRLPSILFHLH